MQTYAISLKIPGLTEAEPTIRGLLGTDLGTMHKSYSCVASSSRGIPNSGNRGCLYWYPISYTGLPCPALTWEEVLCFITIWYSIFDWYQWEVCPFMYRSGGMDLGTEGRLRKGLGRENGEKTTVIMMMISNYNNNIFIYHNNYIILQLLLYF